MSLLPASLEKIWSKTAEIRWRHHFPHYKSMGAFCCHGNQSFDSIIPKPYAAFPHPNDASYKIWSRLANWPQRYSSIKKYDTNHGMTEWQGKSSISRAIIKDYIQTNCTSSFHAENIWKVSKQSVENCKRSCAHKVPSILSSERLTELEAGCGSSIRSVFAWHASGPKFDPHVPHILSWRLGHENISTAIFPLPMIQEKQFLVIGERICTKYW